MIRCLLTSLLALAAATFTAHSQSRPVDIAFDAIFSSSSELDTYRDIPIEWKMSGRAQALFNEGMNNLSEDNAAMALKNFNDAAVEDGNFRELYYYRAIASRKLGDFAAAKKDLRFLIDNNHERYYSQIELGKIALLQRDLDESDRCFNKAIRATDNNAYAHYLKANNQMTRGQERAAANGYRDCLSRDSSMYDAMVRLAIINSKKDLSQVFFYLDKVLRRDSLHANALLLRGLARIPENKSLAIRDFSNLIIRDPDLLIGRYLRGIVYCDLGDFDRAFTDFHRLVVATASDENAYTGKQSWVDKKIDIQNLGAYTVSRVYGLSDTDGTALKKAYCLLVSGRIEECINVIDALSISTTEPLCLYLKALSLEHSEKHSKAFEFYTQALALDKDIVDAYKKRGIYYQELKMWDKSIADLTTVLRLQPKTLIALKARGVSYFQSGRLAQALADFDSYLAIDSTEKEVLASRGITYLHQNDVLRGTLDLINAGRLDAIDMRKLMHGVDSVIAKDDTLKVIAALNKITKKAPWYTEVYARKIKLLIATGRWEQVDREIDEAVNRRSADATTASYSYLLTVKAMTKSRAKKYNEAIAILSQAIDVDKKNALAFLERGKLHANAGKSGKAIADLNKAMSLGRKDAGEVLASVRAE